MENIDFIRDTKVDDLEFEVAITSLNWWCGSQSSFCIVSWIESLLSCSVWGEGFPNLILKMLAILAAKSSWFFSKVSTNERGFPGPSYRPVIGGQSLIDGSIISY